MIVSYWNKASESFGITADQAVGKSLWDIFPLSLEEPMHSFILGVQRGEKATRFVQSYGQGDEQTSFEITAYPFRDGTSVIARDISENIRAQASVKASLAQKEVLLQELYHHTKNNMQVISSILSLQAADITDAAALDAFKETENRIQAMALVHQKLYRSKDLSSINLKEYIAKLSSMLNDSYSARLGSISFTLDLEDVHVHLESAIPSGLVLNELVTNALKHAFPGNRPGTILIRLRAISDGFELHIEDDGIGLPPDFSFKKNSRLGLQTVTGIVEHQLGGSVAIIPASGAAFLVTIKPRESQKTLPLD